MIKKKGRREKMKEKNREKDERTRCEEVFGKNTKLRVTGYQVNEESRVLADVNEKSIR